jgi:4-amino-4-deoxy-L-arabinose transferase-like glycosyltransferase
VLLFLALPWTSLLPQAVRYGAAPAAAHRPENRLLLIWSGFIFVFFSLSGSKLPPYILPMLPALALLLGQSLVDAPEGLLRRHAFGIAAVWLLFAVLGVALAVSAAHPEELARLLEDLDVKRWTPNEYDADFARWLIAGSGAYALLALAAGWASARQRKDLSIVVLAVAGMAGTGLLAAGYQAYAPMRSARALAQEIAPRITPDTELFTAYEYDQTLPFYLKRTLTVVGFVGELELGEQMEPERWIPTIDRFIQRWNAAPRALAFTTPETVQQLAGWGVQVHIVHTDKRHVVIAKP